MTSPRQEDWFKGAIGRAMNSDGVYGLQCVDVPNDYANYLFSDWERTIGRGNAKDKYSIAPDAYWEKIPNNPNIPSQFPLRGDVIVWPGMPKIDNPAGHIAVVESATAKNVTVIEQDGFLQVPARRKTYSYVVNGVLPIGWLRPRPNKILGGISAMTNEEYVDDMTDVIEDNPWYRDNRKLAWQGHVDWLNANPGWEKRRAWVKGIMANNGVLNATMMADHRRADQAQTVALDKLEANLNAKIAEADALHKDNTQLTRTVDEMTKTINRQKEELATAATTIEALKAAAKSSDAVAALSPMELIRIAVKRWLGGE